MLRWEVVIPWCEDGGTVSVEFASAEMDVTLAKVVSSSHNGGVCEAGALHILALKLEGR